MSKSEKITSLIVFFYFLIACMIFSFEKILFKPYFDSFRSLIALVVFSHILYYPIEALVRKRPKHPFATLRNEIKNNKKSITSYIRKTTILILIFPIFIGIFSSWKFQIPELNNFSIDPLLSKIDYIIHLNNYPHEILQSLNKPIVSEALNTLYHLWFFIIFGSIIHIFITNNESAIKNQYIYSFFLTWILMGNIFATAAASVGPCFYNEFFSENISYKKHMFYLYAANETHFIPALKVQEDLLNAFKDNRMDLARGISAMPSMHFTSTLLLTIYLKATKSKAFIPMSLFTTAIFIGSIHLGYHYAIDSYFALIPTIIIWKLAGYLAKQRKYA